MMKNLRNRILQEKYDAYIAYIRKKEANRADIEKMYERLSSRIVEICSGLPEDEDVHKKEVKVYDFLNKNRSRPPKCLGREPSTKR